MHPSSSPENHSESTNSLNITDLNALGFFWDTDPLTGANAQITQNYYFIRQPTGRVSAIRLNIANCQLANKGEWSVSMYGGSFATMDLARLISSSIHESPRCNLGHVTIQPQNILTTIRAMLADIEKNIDRQLIIFDTTLRDGQQGPGNALTPDGKMAVARKLQDMNVDVIEAGYAISSPVDAQAISDIAQEIRRPIICSLSMCRSDSIQAAARALEHAEKSRIHLYIGLSPEHREARNMTPQQVIDKAVESVREAAKYFTDIQFSPEDASRTEIDLLVEIAKAVRDEGATTFNVPDTVGIMTATKSEHLFRNLYERIPDVRSGQYILSTHTHNDKGLALPNGLASVKGGARQAEGAMLGIGERTGNMATEQAIMAIKFDGADYESPFGIPSVDHIDTTQIYKTARIVSDMAHHPIPKNQPYVGENSGVTESGTHVNLLNKNKKTYYFYDPAIVGRGPNEISLGSQSGRDAIFTCTKELGYSIPTELEADYFQRFKIYADAKRGDGGTVSRQELIDAIYMPMIVSYTGGLYIRNPREKERVDGCIQVAVTTSDNREIAGSASSPEEGMINALQAAFKTILPDADITANGLTIESIGTGSDAKARATVRMQNGPTVVSASAEHENTEIASVEAQMKAFNHLYALHRCNEMTKK